jgi:hypothetical protein
MTRETRLAAIAMLLVTAMAQTDAANAAVCAARPVSARGEPSAFEWLAKTKARANWRSRVRSVKALGPPYSTWSRAESRTEDCAPTSRGVVCSFTGVPCRP